MVPSFLQQGMHSLKRCVESEKAGPTIIAMVFEGPLQASIIVRQLLSSWHCSPQSEALETITLR